MPAQIRKKPEAQKNQLSELWDRVIGTNGKGLISLFPVLQKEVKEIHKDQGEIKEAVAFIKGKLEGMGNGETEPAKLPKFSVFVKRLAEVAVVSAVVMFAVSIVLLIVFGKLTPEDIANILSAWKGQ